MVRSVTIRRTQTAAFRIACSLPLAAMLGGLLLPAPAWGDQAIAAVVEPAVARSPFNPAAVWSAVRFAPTVDAARVALDSHKDPPRRACAGCPERRLLRPYLETLALHVVYNGMNHLRGHPTARISFHSWWVNMQSGFEWDTNAWGVNQIGHPYQGSNYFTAGRANGLSFWESSAVAAVGSATWEYFGENNRASLNDFINTTLGGVALGEVLHRTAWLVRDPTKDSRRSREIVAAIIDPMSGLARVVSDDPDRVAGRPSDMMPSQVASRGGAGVLWQGASFRQATVAPGPFVDLDFLYGDVRAGRSRTPYEAFTARIAAGGSLAEIGLRGRLYGAPFGPAGAGQFSIVQTFDFIVNPAYAFGGQGFEAEAAFTRPLSSRASLWVAATGGATVLAAVDTLLVPPPGATIAPGDARRTYDYGAGARFGGTAQLIWKSDPLASLSYQGYQVSVVDGSRAGHVLQRVRLDVRVPVMRRLAIGAAGEYFFRTAYFWAAGTRTDQSPQFRVFLAWSRR